jgi:5'(3')-deoxyribonucleotidase
MTLPKLFIDMDNTIVDTLTILNQIPEDVIEAFGVKKADQTPGIFRHLAPMPDAIESLNKLADLGFELRILSTAPWNNPSAWTDKLLWIQDYFGVEEENNPLFKHVILAHDKNECRQPNAILIDDHPMHGAELWDAPEIGCEFWKFGADEHPDWKTIVKQLEEKYL